jgi:hypothetical protein
MSGALLNALAEGRDSPADERFLRNMAVMVEQGSDFRWKDLELEE